MQLLFKRMRWPLYAVKILISTVVAFMLGCFITLHFVNAQVTLPERVSILEERAQDVKDKVSRLDYKVDNNFMALSSLRDKVEDLETRIGVITGIGIGLSSFVVILQFVQIILGMKKERRGES